MAENLPLGDLVDSISLLRGQSLEHPLRSVAMQEVAKREADAMETAIFDAMASEVAQARAQKYSVPGGPNETAMPGRKFPLQVLSREQDPLDEIMKAKEKMIVDQFKFEQMKRMLTRNRQAPR